MSIFRRDEPASSSSSSPASPRPTPSSPPSSSPDRRPASGGATHVASGSKVVGEVHGIADLVVEGELEGQVKLDSDVTIGADGTVKGNIDARSVRIGGRVVGNVRGGEKVEILATGRLEGDVIAPRVVLAEGAFFKGKVEMTGKRQGGGKGEAGK